MREEHWKPVPVEGYEDLYSVSDMGRVMSHHHGCDQIIKIVLVGPWNDRRPAVNLHCKGAQRMVKVHTLVLKAFAGNPEPDEEACHGKGGMYDNRYPENLSWGTREDNLGRDKRRDGTFNSGPKMSEGDVREVHVLKAQGWSANAISQKMNVTYGAIQHILHGRRHRHIWLEFNA